MIGRIVQFKAIPGDTAEPLKGIVIRVFPHPDPDLTICTIALTTGEIVESASMMFEVCESDVLAMIQLPPYPAIESDEDAEQAALHWARVAEVRRINAARIMAVEQDIQRRQDELAAAIRGEHAELYHAQQVVGAVYDQHEKRNHNGALALWESKGRPEKGKRFGAVQIEERDSWVSFDPAAALAYCQTQAPNMVITQVDEKRFKKAVLEGLLVNVPTSVCKSEKSALTKTLSTKLAELSGDSE